MSRLEWRQGIANANDQPLEHSKHSVARVEFPLVDSRCRAQNPWMKAKSIASVVAVIFSGITWAGAQVPAFLELNLKNNSSYTGSNATEDVYVYFSNGAAPASGAPAFNVTFNSGTAVSFGTFQGGTNNSTTFQNYLSNPIALSSVTGGSFEVTTAISVGIYLAYGTQFASLSAAPTFLPGGNDSYLVPFQNLEITRTGGQGDQGNLTNINYFTAPLSITSYSNGVQKQHTGFSQNAQQIATTLRLISPDSEIKSGETTLRFAGPSTYPPANVPPYNSFIPYMQAVNDSGVTNLIQNANAFNTNGSNGTNGSNYNFQFNLNTGFTTSGGSVTSLDLSGNITTQVKDNSTGITGPGPTFEDASVTIDLTNVDNFNGLVYGQSLGQYSSTVAFGSGWTAFENFVNDPTNELTNSGAYGTTQAFSIGEITSAILMGFLGNTQVVGGEALNTMPSSDWWKLNPLVAFDEIQSDPDFYNEWANAIYAASSNGAYSIPYSDRLGTGPLVNSVYYNGDYITSWDVGIFDPVAVPEPSTLAILALVALTGAAWRARRARRAKASSRQI